MVAASEAPEAAVTAEAVAGADHAVGTDVTVAAILNAAAPRSRILVTEIAAPPNHTSVLCSTKRPV